jgi:hypothetical protein
MRGDVSLPILMLALAVAATCATAAGHSNSAPAVTKIPLDYFFEPGCADCEKLRKEVFPSLKTLTPGSYVLNSYDVGEKTNYLRLVSWQVALTNEENEDVSVVVNGRHFLAGFDKIDKNLMPLMEKYW